MQMVFQDPFSSLNPKHSIGEVVREPLDIHWTTKTLAERACSACASCLKTVGLAATDADKYPHEFSGGQRQRIAIARALALEPRLLVADEPVSALDVSIQSQILNLLMELRREHRMAMLFISHDLSVVRHISDDVAVMYFGHIVEMAPARDVFEQPAHPYTRLLLSSIPSRNRTTACAAQLATPTTKWLGAELPDPANPPRPAARLRPLPAVPARAASQSMPGAGAARRWPRAAAGRAGGLPPVRRTGALSTTVRTTAGPLSAARDRQPACRGTQRDHRRRRASWSAT
jgi:oligopeptide/dipeptide ABC transporter ATP-binding protein